MIVPWIFVALHALALLLGLFGLLVALPHPELFAGNAAATAFYGKAMTSTGGTAMFLGALAMLAYGFRSLGVRRTLIFFFAATIISATAELTGTKTGWPFGGYEYTNFLGPKLLGRVPVAVPLSWFYMGFAALIIAGAVTRGRTWLSILLGTWLLVSWDLVLDPSMAAPSLQYIHFWIWHETGPYFGMPLRNLIGWFGTGFIFIAVGRLAWNEPDPPRTALAIPYSVYAINVLWSMILSIAAGMWPTAGAAILVSLLPATFALRRNRRADA